MLLTDALRRGSGFYPYGWWHPAGWVLYTSGYSEAWPADLAAPDEFGLRRSALLGFQFYPYEGMIFGGSVYYDPAIGGARNSRYPGPCLVGVDHMSFDGIGGYFCTWVALGVAASSVQARWRVDVVVSPDGIGIDYRGLPQVLPSWAGRDYPQWPPRGRGRPQL